MALVAGIRLHVDVVAQGAVRPVEELDDAEPVVDGLEQRAVARLAGGQGVARRALLGDVAGDAREPDRTPVGGALDLAPAGDPAKRAGVGAADAVLDVPRRLAPPPALRGGDEVRILGDDQPLEGRGRVGGGLGQTVEAAELRRRMEDAVVDAHREHPDAAGLLRPAQAHLRLSQGIPGPVLLGTVAQDLDVADMAALAVPQGHHLARGPEPGAVRAQVPALVLGAALRQGQAHLGGGPVDRAVLGGEQSRDAPPPDRRRGPAEDARRTGIPVGHRPVAIGPHDGKARRAVEDRLPVRRGLRSWPALALAAGPAGLGPQTRGLPLQILGAAQERVGLGLAHAVTSILSGVRSGAAGLAMGGRDAACPGQTKDGGEGAPQRRRPAPPSRDRPSTR